MIEAIDPRHPGVRSGPHRCPRAKIAQTADFAFFRATHNADSCASHPARKNFSAKPGMAIACPRKRMAGRDDQRVLCPSCQCADRIGARAAQDRAQGSLRPSLCAHDTASGAHGPLDGRQWGLDTAWVTPLSRRYAIADSDLPRRTAPSRPGGGAIGPHGLDSGDPSPAFNSVDRRFGSFSVYSRR